MFIRNLRSGRRLAVLAIFAIVALSAFGFAASNVVPESKAGDGDGVISGYEVSGIHYVLDATDPSTIDEVEFTLDSVPAAGSTITIRLNGAGSWYSCTNSGADVTCDVSSGSPTVLAANNLRVVVAD